MIDICREANAPTPFDKADGADEDGDDEDGEDENGYDDCHNSANTVAECALRLEC